MTLRPRVIPHLLVQDRGLYKGQRFKKLKYVGDPLNTLRLFNELRVDELIINDPSASYTGKAPDLEYLTEIASEAFMPLAYGGGIGHMKQMEKIFSIGFEKIVLNTAAVLRPNLIAEAAEAFGSQSIVISIDYRRSLFGKLNTFVAGGRRKTKLQVHECIDRATDMGAGEIILCSVDNEGSLTGYDLDTIAHFAPNCPVPLVASGGAGSLSDFEKALSAGASAVAAGSLFIFQGPHRAVLVNYPDEETLDGLFERNENLGQ